MKKRIISFLTVVAIILPNQIKAQDLTTDLLECMNFSNDLSLGNDYYNAVPNGGNIGFTTDKLGNSNAALKFTGNYKPSLRFTGSVADKSNLWTISFWVKPNSMPTPGYFTYLYSLGSDGGDQTLILKNNTIEIGNYQISGAAQTLVSETLSPNFANSWHHIVALKKTDSLQLYIDGVLNKSVKATRNTSYYGTAANPTETMGCRYNSTYFYNGALDQFRRYNSAITKSQIDSLYNTPFLPVTKVRANNTLLRFLAMSNNFTDEISNTVATSSNVTFTTDKTGGTNAAANFNISNPVTYSGYQIKTPNLWTISFWVKPNSLSDGISYLYSCGSDGGDQSIYLNNNVLGIGNYTNVGSNTSLTSTTLPSNFINSWHHIVAIKKTDSLLLYIDGIRNNSVYLTENTSFYGYGPYSVALGSRYNNTNLFSGNLDQYKRYSRAFTQQEVKALYNDYQGTCGSLPNSLINCVSFNNKMFDEATNNFVGQYNVPSPTYTTDKLNNLNYAIQVGDIYSTVRVLPQTLTDLWSISMWIKPTSMPAQGQTQYIYSLGAYGGDQTLALTNNTIVLGNYLTQGYAAGLTSSVLPLNFANNWHHIVGIKKQDSLLLYIDGALVGTQPNVPSTSFYGIYVPTEQMLGARYDNTYPFIGSIDQFSRYGRPLSKTEVLEFYQNYSKPCGVVSNNLDEQNSIREFTLYPNPVKDLLEIDLSNVQTAKLLEIYNATGTLITKKEISNLKKESVNVEQIVSGVYVLKIINSDKIYTSKFIKE